MTMTKFTGWVTEMITFCKNGYTVPMAFATKIVEIQWLLLTKIGFLMYLLKTTPYTIGNFWEVTKVS